MSVFDQQSTTNTELATGLGQSDYSLTTNYNGSAPLDDPNNLTTSDTWLPHTKGVDCKLVNGDRWQEIHGSMTQHVAQNKDSTSPSCATYKYFVDFEEDFSGKVSRTMNGHVGEHYNHTASCDRDYLGHVYEHYWAGHQQHNDYEEVEVRLAKFEVVEIIAFQLASSEAKIAGVGVSIAVGAEVSLAGAHVSLAGAHLEAGVYAKSAHVWDRNEAALEEKINAMVAKIGDGDIGIRSWVQAKFRPLALDTGGPSLATAPYTPAVP